MIKKQNKTQQGIIREIYNALQHLGASSELLSIVGSWGDTQEDEDILEMLEMFNKNGTTAHRVICAVDDTHEDKRSRFHVVGKCDD